MQVDCVKATCQGGWPSEVFSYAGQKGMVTEQRYPVSLWRRTAALAVEQAGPRACISAHAQMPA